MNSARVLRPAAWALALAACVVAIYVAAGAALDRPGVLRFDAAVVSSASADYSADERLASRPPLDPEIFAAIAVDDRALDAPASSADGEPVPTRTLPPARVPLPTRTPTPVPTRVEPTDTPQPEPTATDTPEPEPTATDTPEPEPTATATPEPTATDTPEPTATPKPGRCPTPDVSGQSSGDGAYGNNGKKRRCPTPTPTPEPTETAPVDG